MNFDELEENSRINRIKFNLLKRLFPLCGDIKHEHLNRILSMMNDSSSFDLVECIIENYENNISKKLKCKK